MKKVLVVDHELLIRCSLSTLLWNDQVDVITASDGIAALREIGRCSYDLCFLDIHLPDGGCIDIVKKIRERSAKTSIVIMTGSEVTNTMISTVQDNAQLIISKPFDPFQVKKFVDRLFQHGSRDARGPRIVPKTSDAFTRLLADERRKHVRKPVDHVITFFALPLQEKISAELLTADILDISDAGMCMRTTTLFQPGHILQFCEKPVYCGGIVRWIRPAEGDSWHMAGIQFIDSVRADATA